MPGLVLCGDVWQGKIFILPLSLIKMNKKIVGYYISNGYIIFISKLNKEIKKVSLNKIIKRFRKEIEEM